MCVQLRACVDMCAYVCLCLRVCMCVFVRVLQVFLVYAQQLVRAYVIAYMCMHTSEGVCARVLSLYICVYVCGVRVIKWLQDCVRIHAIVCVCARVRVSVCTVYVQARVRVYITGLAWERAV